MKAGLKKSASYVLLFCFTAMPVTPNSFGVEPVQNPVTNQVPVTSDTQDPAPETDLPASWEFQSDQPLETASGESNLLDASSDFSFHGEYEKNGVTHQIDIQRTGDIILVLDTGAAGLYEFNAATGVIKLTSGGNTTVYDPANENYRDALSPVLTILSRAMHLDQASAIEKLNLRNIFNRASSFNIYTFTKSYEIEVGLAGEIVVSRDRSKVLVYDTRESGFRRMIDLETGVITRVTGDIVRIFQPADPDFQAELDALLLLITHSIRLPQTSNVRADHLTALRDAAVLYKEFDTGSLVPANYKVRLLQDGIVEVLDSEDAAYKLYFDLKTGKITRTDAFSAQTFESGDAEYLEMAGRILQVISEAEGVLSEQERKEVEYFQLFTQKRISDAAAPADRRPQGEIKVVTDGDGNQTCFVNSAVQDCPRDADGRLDLDRLEVRMPDGTLVTDVTRVEEFIDATGKTVVVKVLGPQIRPDDSYDKAPVKTGEQSFLQSVVFSAAGLALTAKAYDPLTQKNADGSAMSAVQYINRIITLAKLRKANLIIFPKMDIDFGSSNLTTPHLNMGGLEDVTLDFSGSNFIFEDRRTGIQLSNATRVVLKNLNIDWKITTAGLGNLFWETYFDAQGRQKKRAVLTVDPAYLVNGTVPKVAGVAVWNEADAEWGINGNSVANSENDLGLIPDPDVPGRFISGSHKYLEHILNEMGADQRVLVRLYNREGGGVNILGPYNDVQLKNIAVYSAPGMAFRTAEGGRGVLISDCKVLRKDGRLISTTSDGIHIKAGSDIIVANNNVSLQGDDALNIQGNFSKIAGRRTEGADVILKIQTHRGGMVKMDDEGDIALFDENNIYQGKARFQIVGGKGTVDLEIRLIDAEGIYNAQTLNIYQINQAPTRIVVRDNNFTRNNGRGIVVQGTNGLVDRNYMDKQTYAGIRLTDLFEVFYEGPGAMNIVLSRNTVKNTAQSSRFMRPSQNAMAGINIGGSKTDPWQKNFANIQKIKLIDNTVENVGGAAVFIAASAKNIMVKGLSAANTNLKNGIQFLAQNGSKILGNIAFAPEADLVEVGGRLFRRLSDKLLNDLLSVKHEIEDRLLFEGFEFRGGYVKDGTPHEIRVQLIPENSVIISDTGVTGLRRLNLVTGEISVTTAEGEIIYAPGHRKYLKMLQPALTTLSRAMHLPETTPEQFAQLQEIFEKLSFYNRFTYDRTYPVNGSEEHLIVSRDKSTVTLQDTAEGGLRRVLDLSGGALTLLRPNEEPVFMLPGDMGYQDEINKILQQIGRMSELPQTSQVRKDHLEAIYEAVSLLG